ncbi:MAG TPA: MFS transporter [Microlunatus sp.]|nr:MFS transporter [Microlunatus sp.]
MVDPVRRARHAVGTTFAVNGMTFANLVPRYPEIVAELGLDNAAFGAAVAAWPLGALLSGLFAGVAVTRWSSKRVIVGASVAMSALLVGVGWASSWLALAAVFLCVGLVDALIDIANNAQGLWVQRRIGTSIITGLHGLWSVGAVIGGLIGSGFAGLGVPVRWHLLVTGVLFALALLVASRFLLPGQEPVPGEHGATSPPETTDRARRVPAGVIVRLLLVCLVGLAGAAGEDAGNTWGALYLTGSLGTTAAVGGAVFVAMQTSMIIGRFAGDPLVTRFGPREVSRVGGILTVLGFAVVLAVPSVVAAVVGFGIVGLGIAVLIPLAMHAADELPGLPRGFGLAVSGWMMRVGFLLTPPLVGLVADQVGLRWAFVVPAVLGLLAIGCAGLLAPAERRRTRG